MKQDIIYKDGRKYKIVEIFEEDSTNNIKEQERISKLPKYELDAIKFIDPKYYIDKNGTTIDASNDPMKLFGNSMHSREIADAISSLIKLLWIRDVYNGTTLMWYQRRFNIINIGGDIEIKETKHSINTPLFFKSKELAELFLKNFEYRIKDLKCLY